MQYILRSLSLYTIGKRRGLANYGLAWVPVAYVWTLGSIADQYDRSCGTKRKWRVVLLTLTLVGIGLSVVAYYGYFGMLFGMMANADRMQGADSAAIMQSMMAYCLALIPVSMLGGALNICMMICYYKLFESCRSMRAVCYLLISLLVPFGLVIILMCCRKWDNDLRARSDEQYGDEEQVAKPATAETLPAAESAADANDESEPKI